MKALILAGGRGNRLDPITEQTNKCLVELNHKPLIQYSLDNALAAGIEEAVIVVGHLARQIINRYGNSYRDMKIDYVIQWEQHGLVHALECSKEAIGSSDFMLFLADEILLDGRHAQMIRKFRDENLFVLCGVTTVEDRTAISNTYSIIRSERDQRIYRLIEKPRRPMNDIMGTGNCVFRNGIFEYIPGTPINQKRGERELPDLIQEAVDDGRLIKAFHITNQYVNVNTMDDIHAAERNFTRM